jgi:hypothetical protein
MEGRFLAQELIQVIETLKPLGKDVSIHDFNLHPLLNFLRFERWRLHKPILNILTHPQLGSLYLAIPRSLDYCSHGS